MALGRRHGLDASAHHIVEHVLGGEAPAACLAVGAERERARVFRLELLGHELGPEQPAGAHLGDLHEEIHADRPEEGEAGRETIDVHAGFDTGAHIFDAVGERVAELEVCGRSRFLHVIAGDRDRVELRHLLRGVGEDVGDDAHRWRWRIDISVPHHELFQNVVLNGAGKFFRRHALLLAGDDEEGKHREHRAVHGHRHRHLVERDVVEQGAHVVDRVDGDARHADIAGDARMVGVVAAMGGKVEGDGHALLARGEIAAIEGVRVLCR